MPPESAGAKGYRLGEHASQHLAPNPALFPAAIGILILNFKKKTGPPLHLQAFAILSGMRTGAARAHGRAHAGGRAVDRAPRTAHTHLENAKRESFAVQAHATPTVPG